MNVFELAATLTLDDSEYRKKLDGAGKNVKGFGNTIKKALVPVAKTAASVAGVALSVTAITKAFIDSGKAAVEAYANYEQLAGGVESIFGTGGKTLEEFAEKAQKSTYSLGQRGEDIKKLQQELIKAGYDLGASAADGIFGPKTQAAFEAYTKATGGVSAAIQESYDKQMRAQQTVLDNADKAYKSAGISANEYLSLATSFSGALIRGLGNDTEEAANLTHTAILDMADQANRYGKTAEEVSATYTSLARGNATTLDNLFGGMFAGTKAGLRDMLDYAENYRASMGETVKYSEDNYADIVRALHDVSEATGTYGTTVREAERTISGSHNAMKASWQNLLVAMADGNVDVKARTQELIDGVKTYVGNVAPVVWNYIKSIPEVFSVVADEVRTYATTKFNEIKEKIKEINWQEVGDKVITDITSRISGIVSDVRDWFTRAKNEIDSIDWEQAGRNIVTFIGNAFAKIGDTFRSWFTSGKEGIEGIDWAGAGSAILDFISSAWTGLKEWASGLWDEASNGIKSINWKQVGEDVKTTVGKAWDTLKSWAQSLWMKAKTGIQSVNWAEVATKVKTFISKGWNNLKEWASGIWMKAKTGIQSVKWAEVATKVQGFIEKGWSGLKEWASAIWMKAKTGIQSVNWAEAGGKVKTFISNAWSDLKSWASTLWGNAKDGIESISWTQVGNNIWGWIKTPLLNVASWFTDRFNDASAAIENIEWTQLGTNIWGFIKSAFSETIGWFFHLFDNSRSGIENNVEWEALGQSILNLITTGIKSIGNVFYGLLDGARQTIETEIDWHALGDNLATWIWEGLEYIGDLFLGRGQEGYDAVVGINWWRLGWDIVVAILDGMAGLAQGIYDHAANGIKEFLGLEPDYRSAGQKAVDAILHDWDRLPTDARKQALRAAQAYVDPNDDDTWAKISAIVGDDLMEGIRPIPGQVSDVAKQSANNFGGGRNGGGGGADWRGAGRTAGATVAAGFHDGIQAALGDIDALQKKINNMKGKSVTISVDAKAGANAKGRTAQITLWASAMDRGHIFKQATVFGYENGIPQVAGDAGPEAVVGVHSLDRMIQNSVSHSVSSTQAAMVAVLTEILNVMPKGDLVLDTGALVGGIAGEMNGELERLTAWSGGGRA